MKDNSTTLEDGAATLRESIANFGYPTQRPLIPAGECMSLVGWQSQNCRVELDGEPSETGGSVAAKRHRLPPSPSRSLGGCLDYAGWPDRDRFLELDRVLQNHAQENRDSDYHFYPDEAESDGVEWEEHQADALLAEVIRGFENLPLRRLQ